MFTLTHNGKVEVLHFNDLLGMPDSAEIVVEGKGKMVPCAKPLNLRVKRSVRA